VIAIAVYGVYAALGLVGSPFGLALAHGVLGTPLVIINVAAALSVVPKSYDEAARSLGASSLVSLFTVTLPLIWRGIAAGSIFAFVASFDEVIIAIFLTGTTSITLPRRMIDGIYYDLTPILAAVSGCLVVFNVILAVLGLWFASRPTRGVAPSRVAEAAP
jgi:putative spermidine/putrescine transport system permease protein